MPRHVRGRPRPKVPGTRDGPGVCEAVRMPREPDAPEPPGRSDTPSWREVLQGPTGRLIVGLLLLETLFALHFLTIATVMPAVFRDLGGLALYGWSATAASLGQFAAIPVAGAAVDRFGPRRLLVVVAVVYTGGLMITAFAPSMLVVVIGRFFQGVAAGAGYALSLGTVAKTLPDAHRARVLALLAATWLLPGLFGPPVGGFLATTVGWRWAFAVPLPVLAACLILILPAMRDLPANRDQPIPLLRPLVLMLGAAAFFAGLTEPTPVTVPILVAGLIVAVVTLNGIVPAGTFRARAGPSAAAAAAFLLSVIFAAADYYLPLMFTDVRHRSLREVSLVVAVTPFAWAGGSWWESRQVTRRGLAPLMRVGVLILGVGFGACAAGLLTSVPLWVPYLGWAIAALGMGIAFPIPALAVMRVAEPGREGSDLSPTLLMDMLGVAVGAGTGGAWLALADRTGMGLAAGIAGSFVIAGIGVLFMLVAAGRLPAQAQGTP